MKRLKKIRFYLKSIEGGRKPVFRTFKSDQRQFCKRKKNLVFIRLYGYYKIRFGTQNETNLFLEIKKVYWQKSVTRREILRDSKDHPFILNCSVISGLRNPYKH